MELLEKDPPLDLYGDNRIFSNSNIYPPAFVGPNGDIEKSIVSNGCAVYGKVEHSVLGSNVTIGEGAIVKDSILLNDAVVEPGAKVYRAIIAERSTILSDTVFGEDNPEGPITLLGDDQNNG